MAKTVCVKEGGRKPGEGGRWIGHVMRVPTEAEGTGKSCRDIRAILEIEASVKKLRNGERDIHFCLWNSLDRSFHRASQSSGVLAYITAFQAVTKSSCV